MGGGGRNFGKGNGKGNTKNFTKSTTAWVCKPCDWRNPHAAKYCCKCGKAKQWVADKSQPADPQAAALQKATEDLRKEFNKEIRELKEHKKAKNTELELNTEANKKPD